MCISVKRTLEISRLFLLCVSSRDLGWRIGRQYLSLSSAQWQMTYHKAKCHGISFYNTGTNKAFVLVSVLVLWKNNTLAKSILGEELQSTIEWSEAKNPRQEARAETIEKCCIVLAGSCLASFLTQPRTTYLGNGTTVVNWALQYALLIKAIPHRHAHGPKWWRQLLNWDSCSRYSELCQSDSCW